MQKRGGAVDIARQGARFHVGDAFPSLRLPGEVGLVGAFGLHQVAGASVGFEPGIDGEHHAFAGVGAERLDHALGHTGPVDLFGGVVIGDDEVDVGVAAQVELAHAEAAERDHHHLIVGQIAGVRGRRRFGQRDAVGGRDDAIGEHAGLAESIEDGRPPQHALALDAQHLAAIETAQRGAVPKRSAFELERLADFLQQLRVAQ